MDNVQGVLVRSALLAGGGVAGYFGGRWFIRHCLDGAEAGAHRLCPAALVGGSLRRDALPEAFDVHAIGGHDAGLPATSGLPRHFDSVFEQHRGPIPIEYLRALAMRESGMRADVQSGPAWGLLQIVEVVRHDYNRAHGTRYRRVDLLDPAVNVAIATWLLRAIIRSYARNHPQIPNLQDDWGNVRFVELLTFGWNAGWSEAGGVGRVARYLESLGLTDMTIDLVHEHAMAAGASRHLSNPKKVRWCKGVAALYMKERGWAAAPAPPGL